MTQKIASQILRKQQLAREAIKRATSYKVGFDLNNLTATGQSVPRPAAPAVGLNRYALRPQDQSASDAMLQQMASGQKLTPQQGQQFDALQRRQFSLDEQREQARLATPVTPNPPPEDYRGQNSFGSPERAVIDTSPHLRNKVKTQQQLDVEQNITGQPRYSFMESVPAAGMGGAAYAGGALRNLLHTAGRGVGYVTDNVGLTNDWNRNFIENSIIARDMRDRGWHQLVNARSSRAYDDQYGGRGAVAREMLDNNDPNYDSFAGSATFNDNFVAPTVGYGAGPLAAMAVAPAAPAVAPALSAATFLGPASGDFSETINRRAPPTAAKIEQALLSEKGLTQVAPGDWQINIHGGVSVPLSELSPEQMQMVMQSPRGQEIAESYAGRPDKIPGSVMNAHERVNNLGMPTLPSDPPPVPDEGPQRFALPEGSPDSTLQATYSTETTPVTAAPAPQQEVEPQPQQEVAQSAPQDTPPQQEFDPTPHLPPDATPEQKQQVSDAAASIDPTAAQEALNDPDVAAQKQAEGQARFQQEESEIFAVNNPPPKNANDFGAWVSNMLEHVSATWNNMDGMSKLAFGLGVPLGVIGLLGGGVGGFLMAAAGLGVAGAVGAGAGMFGDQAQSATVQTAINAVDGLNTLTGAENNAGQPAPTSTPATPAEPGSDAAAINAARAIAGVPMGLIPTSAAQERLGQVFTENAANIAGLADKSDDDILALFNQLSPAEQKGLADNVGWAHYVVKKQKNHPQRAQLSVLARMDALFKNALNQRTKKSADNLQKVGLNIAQKHFAIQQTKRATQKWAHTPARVRRNNEAAYVKQTRT